MCSTGCVWRILFGAVLLAATGHAAGLQIVTTTLPAGSVGVAYSQAITVAGQVPPETGTATSTIDSGALPGGLSVVSPPGVEAWTIQGVPSASGSFQFALHIRWTHAGVSPFNPDCTDEAVQTLTISIQAPQAQLTVDRAQVSTTYQISHFPPAAEAVQVSAGGSTAVPFTVQATTASGGSWLSVTPLNAVTPASLSLSFSISGLQPGVYTGTVTLTSGSATQVTIAVSLTVVAATNVVLNAVPRRSRSRSSPEERFRRRNPWPSPYQGRPSSFRPM
jgi:hypothetical protein